MLLIILTLVIFELRITLCSPFNMAKESDNFQSLLLHNDLFVDKSLLIKEFLNHMENYSVPVLVRPEGWGKSTNAAMLKKFFEIEVDNNGERLPEEKLTNRKLFLGGDIVMNSNEVKKLEPLKIANSPRAITHLGNTPVILVKMKNATGASSVEIVKNVKLCISEAFQSHRYLLRSTKITNKTILSNYMNGIMNVSELKSSIFFLSHKLWEHFDRKVHIIIDDYDVPIINAHLSFSNDLRQMDKFQLLIRQIYDVAFKLNPYRSVGLVKGVLAAVKSPVFVVPREPIYQLARKKPPFIEYYGLTEEEVREILTKVKIKSDLSQLQSWYGGYSVFGSQDFCNTRSVMRCLAHNGTLRYYGSNSNITTLVDKILLSNDKQQIIQLLIDRGSVPNYYYSFADTIAISWGDALPEFRVLFLAGYLATDSTRPFQATTIPNEEIRYFFQTKVLRWVCNKFCTDPIRFRSFVGYLLQGQIYPFRQTLQKYLKVADNFYPFNFKRSKVFYGGLIIAVKSALSETHSELLPETGFNKTDDMILIPQPGRNDAAIVITYEVIDQEGNLKSVAKAGLLKIYLRQYGKQWKTYSHIRTIIQISMAFFNEKFHLECSIEKS